MNNDELQKWLSYARLNSSILMLHYNLSINDAIRDYMIRELVVLKPDESSIDD